MTTSGVSSGSPIDGPDKVARLEVIRLAECAGVLDKKTTAYLKEARLRGIVEPFNIQWCVDRGVLPLPPKEQEERI